MRGQLQGKSAIVTGGSRGIGRAIALGLASYGASVVVGYLKNAARAREVVERIADTGVKAIAISVSSTGGTKMFFPGQNIGAGGGVF